MPIKGLIFDLDGVLVDTVPAHFAAWKRMFEEYGYELGRAEYRRLVDGRPRFDGARAVMTRHSENEVRSAADKKNDYYVEMIERGEFRVFDSAVRLVRRCQSEGYGLAAASSSANVRAVLEKAGLLDAFPVVIGGDDVEKGKPNPDIFLTAANGLGLRVGECIVIEDSSSGVEAAKNGGFYCIGLLHEDHESELRAADRVISSLAEIDIEQIDESRSELPI
ncbi:beta-phosphoglucomutase family hydrolase [Ruegeria sp. 2205SS24-7]|uniref:HAD family hydrolase n=1 Tax=Ruegeria discodermiae TaxID=3064389 RepID=UPI002741159A|nr:beta-phosphoglucomutase family hydrolase [Ruegeria sp. 2205SS24-7]MDP5220231.1 beta-phosphoglucomutase family hydrolase [Ruegeria sp. 2205SS24-7]